MTTFAGQWGPEIIIGTGGGALPAGQMTIFESDGVTLATIYSDRLRTSTVANPLPIGVPTGTAGTDFLGNATFWAEPAALIQEIYIGAALLYRSPIVCQPDPADQGGGGLPTFPTPPVTADVNYVVNQPTDGSGFPVGAPGWLDVDAEIVTIITQQNVGVRYVFNTSGISFVDSLFIGLPAFAVGGNIAVTDKFTSEPILAHTLFGTFAIPGHGNQDGMIVGLNEPRQFSVVVTATLGVSLPVLVVDLTPGGRPDPIQVETDLDFESVGTIHHVTDPVNPQDVDTLHARSQVAPPLPSPADPNEVYFIVNETDGSGNFLGAEWVAGPANGILDHFSVPSATWVLSKTPIGTPRLFDDSVDENALLGVVQSDGKTIVFAKAVTGYADYVAVL